MSNTPQTVNTTAERVNTIIAAANSASVELICELIIADQPWLGAPILKPLLKDLLGWLDGYVSKAEQLSATFAVIDKQVSDEQAVMSKAVTQVLEAEKSDMPDALKAAIQAYANAQSALVNWDGSAHAK